MEFDDAYANLMSAVEIAYEAGLTEENIFDCVNDAVENCRSDTEHVGGGPKKHAKKLRRKD